jgi:hypothetical protein
MPVTAMGFLLAHNRGIDPGFLTSVAIALFSAK